MIQTRTVEVERFRYLPIPEALLADCVADAGRVASNGELLDAALEARRALEACNAQLKALRELKPPEDK